MANQSHVNGGSWMVFLGCMFLGWSFSFVSNDVYIDREYLPLPVPNESQIARQCGKYYRNYGYILIKAEA